MAAYALEALVIERDEHEVKLIGATGVVPNSGSVQPMRKRLARMLGTHPRKINVPVKIGPTGSVTVLRTPVPPQLSVEETEACVWECVALEGDKLEPLVTKPQQSSFGSKRRRHERGKKPHETPLPRLTRLSHSCGRAG